MPLVSTAIYTAWFRKDSWCYKNFSFLFVNPLYSATIPNGFSLCPYFWLALFSMFVFRPLVYLTIALRAVVRVLHLGALLKWTDKLVPFIEGAPMGMATVVGFTLYTAFGTLLFLCGRLIFEDLREALDAGYASPIFLLILSVFTFIGCAIYADHKGNSNPDRCRVEVYTHVVLGVSVLLSAILQWDLFVSYFLLGIPKLVALIGVSLWETTLWCGSTMWYIIKFTGLGLYAGLTYYWVFLAVIALAWLYGWLVTRYGFGFVGGASKSNPSSDSSQPKVKVTRQDIEDNLLTIADELWGRVDFSGKFSLFKALVKACPECRAMAESTLCVKESEALTLKEPFLRFLEARQRRAEARTQACKRVTGTLLKVCSPVLIVLEFVATHTIIFLSYLWAFVRAKKSGACPYVRFEE